MQPLQQLPLENIVFVLVLNWIRSLGGIMVDERGKGGALRSHRSDFRGNIDRQYGSTRSDPRGYPSVNNGPGRRGASPLNHR